MKSKQVVAVRFYGGKRHEHIVGLCYVLTSETPFAARTISTEDAVSEIEAGDKYFTRDAQGNEAEVKVIKSLGKMYLRTEQDGVESDNLLRLPRYSVD